VARFQSETGAAIEVRSVGKIIVTIMFSALLTLVILPGSVAAIDTYQFDNDVLKDRFHRLNEELRCPKCQNQNLAGSNSPISRDLRAQVYRLLNEGKSDDQIKMYLVERYGEYILYRPKWSKYTWMLWLAPVLLLAIGIAIVLTIIRRSAASMDRAGETPLDASEKQRIQQLMKQTNKAEEDN